MNTQEKKTYLIRSVAHAIDLLEQFRGEDVELGVTDLSLRTRLPKNKVFRLLATFKARNYIEQNVKTENYRLGYKTMELGQTFIRQMKRLDRSRTVMESMVKTLDETVTLSILRDFEVVMLDAVECDHPLRVIPQIGVRMPAYCTAAGKVQIAHLSEEKIKSYISQRKFRKFTPYTIVGARQFKDHLQQVAHQGYAVSREEKDLGVVCVAAPLRDYTSGIVGAISCIGPAQRFTEERIKNKIIPIVTKGAADISAQLGYY